MLRAIVTLSLTDKRARLNTNFRNAGNDFDACFFSVVQIRRRAGVYRENVSQVDVGVDDV